MPKTAAKNLFVSLVLFFALSCAKETPTLKRSELASQLTKICKDEFNLSVHAWDEGQTIWLYSPITNLLDSSGNFNQEVKNNARKLMRTVGRVILNTDEKPRFWCLVLSEIKNGADLYIVGHAQDRFVSRLRRRSSEELLEREVFLWFPNPNAIGDTEGTHIPRHEITTGEYLAYLIQQNLEKKFFSPDQSKSLPQSGEITAEHNVTTQTITIDIVPDNFNQKIADPFGEARAAAKHFLKIYEPQDVNESVVTGTNQTHRYSAQELRNEK